MTQRKIQLALDPRETGDVEQFFQSYDAIIEKNSGANDCKCLTIDSYDPPCPVQRGTYTKLKMTDDSIQITNIDKSFISARCRYFMSMKEIEANSTGNTTNHDSIQYQWLFIGLKAGIHIIDSYRIYSRGKKTTCEQTESLYETAVTYMLKPQQEIQSRPGTYSTWENVFNMSSNVCGVYIPLAVFFRNFVSNTVPEFGKSNYIYTDDVLRTLYAMSDFTVDGIFVGGNFIIEFDINIPFDDFLPFSAMKFYPNFLFGSLEMEIKQTVQNNLVYCLIDQYALHKNYAGFDMN